MVKLNLQVMKLGLHSLVPTGVFSGSNVGEIFEVMLSRRKPQKPEHAEDFVRIHFLNTYTYLIDYSIVSDTVVPLLRHSPIIPKLKELQIIAIGQFWNSETISNLQSEPMIKSSFDNSRIDFLNNTVQFECFERCRDSNL